MKYFPLIGVLAASVSMTCLSSSVAQAPLVEASPISIRGSVSAGHAATLAANGADSAIGAQQNAPARQPNVVVILADDLGYADVSAYYPGRFNTPNIDRLGREGVTFTQGYVAAPVCAPSRAGLLTGRQPQRYGFEYLPDGATRAVQEHLGLATGEKTIASLLQEGGYRTSLVGKWHLGLSEEFYPTQRGFDEFWGFLPGQTNYIEPTAADAVNIAPASTTKALKGNLDVPRSDLNELNTVITGPDRKPVDLGDGYLTDQITDHATDFIKRNSTQPFFLYVSYSAPHSPFQATRKYYDRFPDIADRKQRIYAAMISALDDGVGQILDTLDSNNIGRDTIVIFLSDNGCAGYSASLCSDKPVSGAKLTQLEGGVRVPFMMRYPARVKPGMRETRPVSSLDMAPTIIAAAGLSLPQDRVYDGRNILPAKSGRPLVLKPQPIFWRTLPLKAVRDGDWKYHRDYDGNEFLYNLRNDPTESTNLATKMAGKMQAMRQLYAQWEADKEAPSWTASKHIEFDFGGRHFKFNP
ncbi:sulfatase-like hydrolase/transferase [Hephaestia sp. GCM10023244]|uniref:sulfatase-like hydrolase/transferase n=1 Tax=unclassified Hephaestia TaxID=2631281 RepID=UPI0020778C47|nr:sulfatase-like hydrolase/transferase [Hephaestia sp. MAHUQ-44]MCM8732479.1 sulfatase-like hydrolase/transferase [Hephaestia sp. MAHUQ-44]